MSESLSPHIERLTRQYVDGNRFSSCDDVLVFALALFGQFEDRFHDQLGQSLKSAFEKVENGEGLVLNGRKEIDQFFDDMMIATRSKKWSTH